MADRIFNLPDLGEGLTEAEIVEWLVDDRADVTVDQNVVVVETAKATVEVPIPYAGTVATRHGAPGDTVAVGAPLITVSSGAPATEESDEGSGAVLIGYGTGHGQRTRRRRDSRPAPAPSVEAPVTVAEAASPQVISPIVRRLARDHGLDLRALRPASGTVLRRSDIESAIAADRPSASTPVNAAAPAPEIADERIRLSGVRRAIADKVGTAHREIPDATAWVDVDATELLAARDELRAENVGLLGLLGRLCVAALRHYPELNASVDGGDIVRHGRIHLGFAAQSPRGLVVPVVHDAHHLSARELSAAMRDLTARARAGRLSPAELTGGTFTLNNYGVFGVDGSTPILNHPEAGMLGIGRIVDRPWVVDGQLAVRKVAQLGVTFDHRVCDGGSAGGFLRFVADAVERPVRLLADW